MKSNSEISRALALYAELLLLHDKDERLADLLSGAAYRIKRTDEPLATLKSDALKPLYHPRITATLTELIQTNTLEAMDELVQLTPSGLFDMMRIKGLGGKKLHVLWKRAKIDSVEELLAACKASKLQTIPGFGAKTEQNIITAIEAFNSSTKHFHYADVAKAAEQLVTSLQKVCKTDLISLCGEVRRQTTTVSAIEIIAAVPTATIKGPGVKKIMTIATTSKLVTTGHTLDEMPVTIFHVAKKDFYNSLFEKTGSEGHVARVLSKIKNKTSLHSEEEIYKKAALPFIVPELREDNAEWAYSKNPIPLITDTDIKGVVHNHTDWSDGVDRLEAFAKACKQKKYEYVVISDHSQNAYYAGGLKPDKVLQQFEKIDALNKQLAPFKIFKSIECDILISGDLDYTPALLKKFDLVIISIHQLLRMNEEKATTRLIKAIENPYTTILGHMTGRQLLIRPGYPVNFKKVIDACAANNVVIEINANPYRLDMDWSHIPYALGKGVMISVNPDAHSIHEIDNIHWGVSAARKGGLTKEMTWNALPLKEITAWLAKKRGKTKSSKR